MNRRHFLGVSATAAAVAKGLHAAAPATAPAASKLIGMYVHEGWVYNRPYGARTWTDDDWHGYLDGLHKLGYNLVTIWPQLEIVPHPMAPSDKAKLEQHARIIDMAHKEFGMTVWVVTCANIVPMDDAARRFTFERRLYYTVDLRVNPADAKAVEAMMARREELFKPLAAMDALVIIDSDPGCYPGSTNAEFVNLLVRHRQLLDKLRPGAIELVYWAWAGWQAYARYYSTGEFAWGTDAEFIETLNLLKQRNPEPWGIARVTELARKVGLESKVISFNYGAIELEPTFPMTNLGTHAGGNAYESGKQMAPRGSQANAQTHCVQLPGTFAFARGAKGLPLTDKDYIQFANDLIPGTGELIFSAWQALARMDSGRIRETAAQVAPLVKAKLETGPLKGLLFGNPNRFMKDLYLMLRVKAAVVTFMNAVNQNGPAGAPSGPAVAALSELAAWLERWQIVTGYEGWWGWMAGGDLNAALAKLNSPALAAVLSKGDVVNAVKTAEGNTAADRIAAGNCGKEGEVLRLIQAVKRTVWEMGAAYPDALRVND